jgi:hypothetical protein
MWLCYEGLNDSVYPFNKDSKDSNEAFLPLKAFFKKLLSEETIITIRKVELFQDKSVLMIVVWMLKLF